uniref:Protein Nef n=1 Tax=Human immunodeficiency virus type 1 TaxID=11676 RepID=Q4GZV4_HV1|nr:negative factor [Human immunodeficiency virus 1]
MGGKWSKSSIVGWPEIRERIRKTPPTAAAPGVGAVSQDLEKYGAVTSSNTAANNASCAQREAAQEEENNSLLHPMCQHGMDDEDREANEGENNSLLHPMCQHGMDDEDREVLRWKFDSRLALKHRAQEMYPEYYKNC